MYKRKEVKKSIINIKMILYIGNFLCGMMNLLISFSFLCDSGVFHLLLSPSVTLARTIFRL